MYRILILSMVLLLGGVTTVIAEDGNGGYAGSFLDVPIGARPAAMGGAYLSIADDGSGPMYNPAGLSNIRKTLFSSSYRLMDLDRTLGYVSLAIPAAKKSALAFGWRYAGSGTVDARNTDGDKLGFEIAEHNHEFTFVFTKRFEDFFAAGVRGSYLYSRLSEMTTYAASLDVGLMLYLSQLLHNSRDERELAAIQDIQVGLVLKNLGSGFRWNNEKYLVKYVGNGLATVQEDAIPIEIGAGASARFFKRKLVMASDLLIDLEGRLAYHGGTEFFVSPEFALRGGYSNGRLTAGTGYVIKVGNLVWAIDYAFSTDKADEGSEHIFGFDLLF